MNFVFLSIFVYTFVANADPMSILQPVKQMSLLEKFKANPNAFVSEMSEADPAVLRQILSMLDGLLTTSESREGELVDNLGQKESALNDANGRVVAAQGVLAQAVTNQAHADAAVAAANADLAARQAEQGQAQVEKDDAQHEHDSEIDALNDEQAVLRQVIDLLKNLMEQQTPATRAPMEKYFWKFTILANHGAGFSCVDELTLFDDNDNAIEVLSATSSPTHGGHGPDRAHDARIGGQGENGGVPSHFCMLNVQGFITYEIPGHSNVRRYEIVTEPNVGESYTPSSWKVETSPDSAHWTLDDEESNVNGWQHNVAKSFDFHL